MTKYGRNKFAQFARPSTAPAAGVSEIYFDPSNNGCPMLYRPDGTYTSMIDKSVLYANCSTGADTAAKTVSATHYELVNGAVVLVKFANTNTASAPTLQVGTTTAKSIMYNGSALTDLRNDRIYEFIYDGTYWQCISGVTAYSSVSSTTLTLGV